MHISERSIKKKNVLLPSSYKKFIHFKAALRTLLSNTGIISVTRAHATRRVGTTDVCRGDSGSAGVAFPLSVS